MKKDKNSQGTHSNFTIAKDKYKLKEGQEILFKSQSLIDKTSVETVDTKTGVATLSNQIKVSMYYGDNKIITRLVPNGNQVMKVWDDLCQEEYDVYLASLNIKEKLKFISESMSKLGVSSIVVSKKLNKLSNYIQQTCL